MRNRKGVELGHRGAILADKSGQIPLGLALLDGPSERVAGRLEALTTGLGHVDQPPCV